MTPPHRHLRIVSSPAAASSPTEPAAPALALASALDASLEGLYERHAAYVGALASRVLGRSAEVEDIVQDVFAAAVRGLRRRDDEREIRAWFAKVTVRRCVRQLRLRRLWAAVDLAAEPSYDRLAAPGASGDERQLIIEVYRALDRLPPRLRVPWSLHHVEGEQLERVALLCSCSLATVKRRIALAHERLRNALRIAPRPGASHA
jgi:RNA polymerase sigma-70 factor (ECF subfamily)